MVLRNTDVVATKENMPPGALLRSRPSSDLPKLVAQQESQEQQQQQVHRVRGGALEDSATDATGDGRASLAQRALENHTNEANWVALFSFLLSALWGQTQPSRQAAEERIAAAELLITDLNDITSTLANNSHAKLNAWLALAAFTRVHLSVPAARKVFESATSQRIGAYYRQFYESAAGFEFAHGEPARGHQVLEMGVRKKVLSREQANEIAARTHSAHHQSTQSSSATSSVAGTAAKVGVPEQAPPPSLSLTPSSAAYASTRAKHSPSNKVTHVKQGSNGGKLPSPEAPSSAAVRWRTPSALRGAQSSSLSSSSSSNFAVTTTAPLSSSTTSTSSASSSASKKLIGIPKPMPTSATSSNNRRTASKSVHFLGKLGRPVRVVRGGNARSGSDVEAAANASGGIDIGDDVVGDENSDVNDVNAFNNSNNNKNIEAQNEKDGNVKEEEDGDDDNRLQKLNRRDLKRALAGTSAMPRISEEESDGDGALVGNVHGDENGGGSGGSARPVRVLGDLSYIVNWSPQKRSRAESPAVSSASNAFSSANTPLGHSIAKLATTKTTTTTTSTGAHRPSATQTPIPATAMITPAAHSPSNSKDGPVRRMAPPSSGFSSSKAHGLNAPGSDSSSRSQGGGSSRAFQPPSSNGINSNMQTPALGRRGGHSSGTISSATSASSASSVESGSLSTASSKASSSHSVQSASFAHTRGLENDEQSGSHEEEGTAAVPAEGEFGAIFDRKNVIHVNGYAYARLGTVGRGGSSKVYRVLGTDGSVLALKRIKLQRTDREALSPFRNEIAVLERLRGHPRIIHLVDAQVNVEKRFVAMVMEEGEIDLNHVLQERRTEAPDGADDTPGGRPPALPINFIRLTWMSMLLAVDALHEARIVHGDLKPANFLFVRGQLKLIDFGIARALSNDTTNIVRDTQVGTLNYMSPEAIADTSSKQHGAGMVVKLGRASDIWSLGCILYQMVFGRTPFAHLKLIQKIRAIADNSHVISFPEIRPRNDALIDTIRRCLQRDARLRPTVQGERGRSLLLHPFLEPEADSHASLSTEQEQVQRLLEDGHVLAGQLNASALQRVSAAVAESARAGRPANAVGEARRLGLI